MKALVINLARETARMAFMQTQLTALGIAFDRLEATTPTTLTPDANAPYWTGWQRPMRTTEMAALASHRSAWQRVVDEKTPMLILEDDAVLHAETATFLTQIEPLSDAELVTLETRGRRKLIAKTSHPSAPMHRLWQDRTGAAAYVLHPSGARKLLDHVSTAPGLADGILCAAYNVTAWQAVPALAVQLDRCEAEGITAPIPTQSAIDQEVKPNAAPSAAQRMRRIKGQLRMGLRQIYRASSAERVIIPFGTI